MDTQETKGVKVLFEGSEGTLHITEKSVLFESNGGAINGMERSAIRMIKTNEENEMVVAYADGSNVKSVSIKPLEVDTAQLLVRFLAEHIPATVLSEEFERIYQHWKRKLEGELKQSLAGRPHRLERHEKSQISDAFIEMEGILLRKFGMTGNLLDTVIWRLREKPAQFQVGWAKAMFVGHFLPQMIQMASEYYTETHDHHPVYIDGSGMWPEDWERFFLHHGIINSPMLTEELKNKCRESTEVQVAENRIKRAGAPPADYKSWF